MNWPLLIASMGFALIAIWAIVPTLRYDYPAVWFGRNQYCSKCGLPMAWVARDKILYDQERGRGYRSTVWSCPDNSTTYSHEPNDLIPWASKRQYMDGLD